MIRAVLSASAAALALSIAPMAMAQAQEAHVNEPSHSALPAEFVSERLHVRVDGEGPRDIILIPGLSSSPEVWDSTVAHLGDGWRVHRIHVQGFAGAPAKANAEGDVAAPVAEEIARYIREKGLNKPAVVGHSMGGTMGMMVAARHPELVGRLMVVDMVPWMGAMFGPPGATVEQVRPVADQIHAGWMSGTEETYQAQAAAAITGMINTESLRAGPLEDSRTSDKAVSANAYRELIVTDLRPELANITIPTEVIYIKFPDPRMTPEITDGMYQASFATLPGVELKRIDDSAHFIMLDQPAVFFAELDAFLAE